MMRHELLQQLDDPGKVWEMIVIGGGATGLGIAVDAAARGYHTLLLEQRDFASGTSIAVDIVCRRIKGISERDFH